MLTRRERAALWLLTVGAILLPLVFIKGSGIEDIEGYEVPKELVLHVAVLGAALLCLGAADRVRLTFSELALLVVLLLSAISAASAVNGWIAWRAVAINAAGAAALFGARRLANKGQATRLLAVATVPIVLTTISVLVEAYGGFTTLSLHHRAPSGGHGSRNFAAHLIALGLPLITAQLYFTAGLRRIAWTAALGLATMALVLTRCRAAWLAAFGCAALAPIVGRLLLRRPIVEGARAATAAAAMAVVAGVMIAVVAPSRVWGSPRAYVDSLRTIAAYDAGSGRGRLIQYRHTLSMFREHPLLGVGPGQWSVHYPRYAPPPDPTNQPGQQWQTPVYPTSDWIGLLAERGLPALAMLLLGFIALARALISVRSLVGLAVLGVLGIMALFDSVLQLPAPTFFVYTVLGALTPHEPGPAFAEFPTGRGLIAAAAIPSIACAIGLARGVWLAWLVAHAATPEEWVRAADAAGHNDRAQIVVAEILKARGRCEYARYYALRALALRPENALARGILAACPP